MRPPFLFLASVSGEVPIDLREYGFIALVVVCVFVVLLTLSGVGIAIWSLRRNPPIEREIDERIKAAVEKSEADTQKQIGDVREEMLRLNQERRVTLASLFSKLDEVRKETKAENQQLQATINKNFQDLNFIIGRLDGQQQKASPAS